VLVTESAATPFAETAARFDLGHEVSDWLSPLIYHLPAQLLVLHMAADAGVSLEKAAANDETRRLAYTLLALTCGAVAGRFFADGLVPIFDSVRHSIFAKPAAVSQSRIGSGS